jgi:hypothetical protein
MQHLTALQQQQQHAVPKSTAVNQSCLVMTHPQHFYTTKKTPFQKLQLSINKNAA